MISYISESFIVGVKIRSLLQQCIILFTCVISTKSKIIVPYWVLPEPHFLAQQGFKKIICIMTLYYFCITVAKYLKKFKGERFILTHASQVKKVQSVVAYHLVINRTLRWQKCERRGVFHLRAGRN